MADIRSRAKRIKGQIMPMDQKITELEASEPANAKLRIKRTQQTFLVQKFVEVMNRFNAAQIEYRDKCKSKIQRQLEIS